MQVQPVAAHFVWNPLALLKRPLLQARGRPDAGPPHEWPRLDLLAALLKQGFELVENAGNHFRNGGALVFPRRAVATGTKLFMVCLVERERIFSRGAASIHTKGSAAYYRALLHAEDTFRVEAAMEVGDKCVLEALAAKGPVPEPLKDEMLAIEDVPPEEPEALPADEEDKMPFPFLVNGFGDDAPDLEPVEWAPAGETWARTIHFMYDGVRRDQLRGWDRCPCPEHGKCYKFQHLSTAGSRPRLIAFLMAWCLEAATYPASEGEGPNPHQAASPNEAMVERAFATYLT